MDATSTHALSLNQGWKGLISGNLPLAWEHLSSLKARFSLGEGVGLPDLRQVERTVRTQAADTVALQACLCDVSGDRHNAEALLTHALSQAAQLGLGTSFFLSYAAGRIAFRKGDYSSALESFLRATSVAKDPVHLTWVKCNTAFCYGNLGLASEPTLDEAESLMLSLPADEATLPRIQSQLTAERLRRTFYQGKLEAFFERAETAPVGGQAEYLHSWVRALPYHGYSWAEKTSAESEAAKLAAATTVDFCTYRFRTLQGLVHPEDSHLSKPAERIDRLYLWTWRWLLDPDSMPASKLATALEHIRVADVQQRLTREDRQLLRNALGWIGLFDFSTERKLHLLVTELQGALGDDFPLLRFEYWVCQYWRARRKGETHVAEDLLKCLRAHELWSDPQLRLRALVECAESVEAGDYEAQPLFAKLQASLRGLIPNLPHIGDSGSAVLRVDFRSFEVRDLRTGRKTVSESMVRALDLLREEENVSLEDFVSVCFGITRFDPLIHNPKIFNLLSRLKPLCGPHLVFRTKSGRVFCEGTWAHIDFHGSRSLPKVSKWVLGATGTERPNNLAPSMDSTAELSLAFQSLDQPPYWEGFMNREGIERLVVRPRSTTNRLLSRWIAAGKIEREGKRKLAKYRWRLSL